LLAGLIKVTPEPLLEFMPKTLHPAPYHRVIGFQAPLRSQLSGIPQR
jgi:hypothetical protein